MAILKFRSDDGIDSEVRIDAQNPIVKIGRADECAIQTKNNTVSRRHSQVVFTGSGYKLYDLNSSNGTFFDRNRITEHQLTPGDVFFCGNFRVEFVPEEPVAPPAPVFVPEPDPEPVIEATLARPPIDLDQPSWAGRVEAEPAFAEAAEAAVDFGGGAVAAFAPQPVAQPLAQGRIRQETADYRSLNVPEPVGAPVAVARVGLPDDARTRELEAEVRRQAEELELLKMQLDSLNAVVDEAAAGEEREHQERLEVEAQLGAAQAQLDEIQRALGSDRARLEAAQAELDAARQAEREALALRERVAALETELGRTASLEAELAQAQGEAAELRARADAPSSGGPSAEDVERMQEDMSFLQDELDEVRRSLAAAEEQRGAAESERARLEAAVQTLEERVAAQDAALASAGAEAQRVAELEEEVRSLTDTLAAAPQPGEMAELKRRHEEADAQRREAFGRVAALEDQLSSAGDLRERLGRAEAARDTAEREVFELKDLLVGTVTASEAERLHQRVTELENALAKAEVDADRARKSVDEAVARAMADASQAGAKAGELGAALKEAEERATRLAKLQAEGESREADLKARLAAAEKDRDEARAAHRQASERAAALESEVDNVRASLAGLSTDAQGAAAEREALLKKVEEAELERDIAAEELESATKAHATAEKKARDLDKRVKELEGQATQAALANTHVVSALEAQLATARDEAARATQALEDAKASHKQARKAGTTEIERLTVELDAARAALSSGGSASEQMQAEIERLRAETKRVEGALEAAVAEGTRASDEAREVRSEIERLQAALAAEGAAVQAARAEAARLEGELGEAKRAADDARAAASAGAGDADALRGEAEAARKAAKDAEARLVSLQEEFETVLGSNKSHLKKIAAFVAQIEELEQQVSAAGASGAALGGQQEARVAELESELAAERATVARLREDLDRLEVKLTRLRESLDAAEAAAAADAPSPSELARLRSDLSRLEADNAELREKASRAAPVGDAAGFQSAVRRLYEDVNDVASGWRNNVKLCKDYFEEIQAGFDDPDQREITYDGLTDTLEQLRDASETMKDKLRDFRQLLDG